jgi:hypothetical protein
MSARGPSRAIKLTSLGRTAPLPACPPAFLLELEEQVQAHVPMELVRRDSGTQAAWIAEVRS